MKTAFGAVKAVPAIFILILITLVAVPATRAGNASPALRNQATDSSQTTGSTQTAAGAQTSGGTLAIDALVGTAGKTVTTFNGKVWSISNPELLKKHEGQHVEIEAVRSGSSQTVTVQSVMEFANLAHSQRAYLKWKG